MLSACFVESKYVRQVRLGVLERLRAGVGSLAASLAVAVVVAVVFASSTVRLQAAYAVLAFLELLAFSRSAQV